MPHLTNSQSTDAARLADTVVNKIMLLKISGLPICADEIAQRTAALFNRRRENAANRKREFFITRLADPASRRARVNACFEQAFGRINIPYADHDVARKQHLLDRTFTVSRAAVQKLRREFLAERLHSQTSQQGMRFQRARIMRVPQDCTESPRIGQTQYLIFEHHVEMIMLLRRNLIQKNAQVA